VPDTRTVIVCMPPGKPIDWFSASEILDWHHQPAGTPQSFFPVRRGGLLGWASRWSDFHPVQATRRLGAVTRAAGGRRSRLDLTAAAVAANTEATARWRTWAQVVRDTPPARSGIVEVASSAFMPVEALPRTRPRMVTRRRPGCAL
jgi:hypothetical protein